MTKTGSFLKGIHSLVREAGSEGVKHSVITNKIAPSLTQCMHMNLSKLCEIVKDREVSPRGCKEPDTT